MRIVLSRKGVDSEAGRIASPILHGRLISLPIPLPSDITYGDLRFNRIPVAVLATDLSNGRLKAQTQVHLDPDLRHETYPREDNWRPIFGQGEPAAEAHLYNCGVTVGDLFLYYGWFRHVERHQGKYRYIEDAEDLHVIYGWLQVGAIIPCDDPNLSDIPWARYHPHFAAADGTAYISSKALRLRHEIAGVPGAGYFDRYHDSLRLTAPSSQNRREWRLPRWFYPRNGCFPLTYHPDKESFSRRGNYTFVRSTARGQEFVLDSYDYPEAVSWARNLILKGIKGT